LIVVRGLVAGDLETIGRDAAEEWVRGMFKAGADFSGLLAEPYTNVATIDEYPIAAGGFFDQGNGLAIAWSILGKVPTECFVALVKIFRKFIRATPYRFIEAHCMASFHQSHRWVKCLGFEPVNGERCFTPDGREFRKFVFRNDHHGA
jgi:hypothetical protein